MHETRTVGRGPNHAGIMICITRLNPILHNRSLRPKADCRCSATVRAPAPDTADSWRKPRRGIEGFFVELFIDRFIRRRWTHDSTRKRSHACCRKKISKKGRRVFANRFFSGQSGIDKKVSNRHARQGSVRGFLPLYCQSAHLISGYPTRNCNPRHCPAAQFERPLAYPAS